MFWFHIHTIYDSIQALTYVWRTRAWKKYLGVKTVKIIYYLYVSRGKTSHIFRFWHLKPHKFDKFWEKFNFLSDFGQKWPFWGDKNFDALFSSKHINRKTIKYCPIFNANCVTRVQLSYSKYWIGSIYFLIFVTGLESWGIGWQLISQKMQFSKNFELEKVITPEWE